MELSITQPAVKWFINEMDLKEGDFVRFFVRYGGHGGIHKGFSLGISTNDTPNDPALRTTGNGITFFVEKSDAWYFDGMNFHIKYTRKFDDIDFVIK
ncbi:Iron-sulphur cluster biosynthesis [Paraliobacillus sp. PM-2]|uniref:HesB/YadR/YfhF family protein n=1 Tax=Paraliobacillus sp. PM-2 TaxID=1462524 RepID=UPI00061BD73C|nr:HesB/YadR/YfhF family protein [Paraliobacillus sp. PM-2]CQR46009.1 Iron-sulphur cluster biosynthesis [Paraliobacillus sp. PM-2]